jgi:hypothetical protein
MVTQVFASRAESLTEGIEPRANGILVDYLWLGEVGHSATPKGINRDRRLDITVNDKSSGSFK